MTTRVACIGDSLTWGFSLPDSWRQSYPALLQERLGADYVVRNFGCNGASVRCDADLPYVQTLAYGESRAWNPDIVLLMLGSNDATPWDWDAAAFHRDYERIVASYRDLPSHPRVILIAAASRPRYWRKVSGPSSARWQGSAGFRASIWLISSRMQGSATMGCIRMWWG